MSQMQDIETGLRDLILGLELGPGERLTERAIEAEFNASRTPVRAALLRLETEGLVCRDGRGWIVAPIDIDALMQLFAYRSAIETAAVKVTAGLPVHDGIDIIRSMLDACKPDSPPDVWHRVGQDFHTELARLSGNLYFDRAVRMAMSHLSRARWLEVRQADALDRAWGEHYAILAAVEAGDGTGAADLLDRHIVASRDRLQTTLQQTRRSLRARGFKVVGG
jgi:DNA-binding GntR family transcriptional regulator